MTLFMNAIHQLHCGNAPVLTRSAFRQAGQYLGVEPWEWPASIDHPKVLHPKVLVANEIALSLADVDFWFAE